MSQDIWGFVKTWNEIIYKDNGIPIKSSITSEELWDEFGIRSAPKFRDACWSHIPERWANEVKEFITQVQNELGDRIEFVQIKEKFCRLTVYFDYSDESARQRMYELINECTEKLINKGVHPPKQEKDND